MDRIAQRLLRRNAFQASQGLLCDFLAPCLSLQRLPYRSLGRTTRSLRLSTTSAQTSSPEARVRPREAHSTTELTGAQQDFLASALRVNQAGELAATLIYAAQTPPLLRAHPHLRSLMKHMADQEKGHFDTFNKLMAKHRVRPTVMYPVWKLAATALGWSTAVMGREAAMACTEAVETEIGNHYNRQVEALMEMIRSMEQQGVAVHEDLSALVQIIRKIRDEELEHLDHAVENDAKEAVPHALLTGVIRRGCRAAIWLTERA